PVYAKDGPGVAASLEAIVRAVPPPSGQADAPLRALVFDSHYDSYKGVIAHVRVIDGEVKTGEPLRMIAAETTVESLEIGIFHPQMQAIGELHAGEVGYIATALKEARDVQVGDTITSANHPALDPVPGYRPVKPMVFA